MIFLNKLFKVRIEAEADKQELKQQLLTIKEKGQALVESLKQRNEQSEFEIRRLKEETAELQNQIQSLKKDAKNSLSVQEDLVRLIQSLQIELNQSNPNMAKANASSSSSTQIEVRCQHEDDFNDCAACKQQFSVTRRKHRCQHCCKIFCSECCSKKVLAGPNLRPHKVCDSCHTLLDKDAPSHSSS
jgi:RUN and FYVE domain-containing protein 1